MKNVLFLTDSLGYPRVEPTNTVAADVWTYRVRDLLSKEANNTLNFYFDMKTGRDSSSLLFDVEYHIKSYKPDVIVLQVGIVDCYSRALTKSELQVLSRIPLVNKVTKNLVRRYYSAIVNWRDIAYVNEEQFLINLNRLKAAFPHVNWLVLPIAPANYEYRKKNPRIEQRIKSYNDILYKAFGASFILQAYDSADLSKLYLSDNHHLSKYGHDLISRKICSSLLACCGRQ